jgi:CelD/BcsL family acetyltransferase involved in cellulose biosynthesis
LSGAREIAANATGTAVLLPLQAALDDPGWAQLARAAVEPNVFTEPAMLRAAAGTVAPSDWQVLRETGPSPGFALVVRRRRLVGDPRFPVAEGFWSPLGPLSTPLLASPQDAASLAAALAMLPERTLMLRYCRLDGPVADALRAACGAMGLAFDAVGAAPRAALFPRLPDPLGGATVGRRLKDLRRLRRRLAEGGEVVHAVATGADVPAALERFFPLEAKGWKGQAGTALASSPASADFTRRLVGALALEGRAEIDSLLVAGVPVAVLVTLRARDGAFIWKIAYDEALAASSPGLQLVVAASERFLADPGLAMVDSLADTGHPMIDRVWSGRIETGLFVIATRPGGARDVARTVAALHNQARLRAAINRVRGLLRR